MSFRFKKRMELAQLSDMEKTIRDPSLSNPEITREDIIRVCVKEFHPKGKSCRNITNQVNHSVCTWCREIGYVV